MMDNDKHEPKQTPEPQVTGNDHPADPVGAAGATPSEVETALLDEETTPEPPAPEPGEVADLKDRLLRALAEMENLRTRTARDIDDARKYAITGFARSLLEVGDNLGRALAAVPLERRGETEFVKNLVVGVEMTEKTLQGVLERHQVRKVMPQKGDKFDHHRHQAMLEVPSSELAPGTIAEVMQAGYVIADRLLRPAMVGVAKAPPAAPAQDEPAAAPASCPAPGAAGDQVDIEA